MNSGETSGTENLDTEIVVIGAGGAGLAAAVTVAEKGTNVIVLEKRRTAGGSTMMAQGLFATESVAQKQQGINAPSDELFKAAMEWTHWRVNPMLIRVYINKSADTIQWLEDKGVNLDYIPAHHHKQRFRTWHCNPENAGHLVIKALVNDCKTRGIQLFYETEAKKILLDVQGNVTGVLAVTNGKELKISTRSIIIGTGGYGGNKELLKKYCPGYNENTTLVGVPNMGDGLLMATEIGAATEGLGTLMMSGPNFRGSHQVSAISRQPNTIWVNRDGKRFADEDISLWSVSANTLRRQPDNISYTLFDSEIKQTVIEKGTIKISGTLSAPKLTKLGEELQFEADKGTVKISDSWDEIARWIGATPEVLKTTIDEYNSFCDQGYDEIFAKDRRFLQPLRTPPYYAIKCGTELLVTLGGIKINHCMEVLNQQDNPIPGLYAVGNEAGGWQWDTYSLDLAGFAFGFAINSGRIAGENAAKYIMKDFQHN